MEYVLHAKGHKNVTSTHKSTFEVTTDENITKAGDCIIGVQSDVKLGDLPLELKGAIRDENTKIKVVLETENAEDEIVGYGHPDLTLKHPTDMVCRRSKFRCSRTLMINADKAAVDLNKELIDDLKKEKELKVTIIVDDPELK
ncbi:MAG: DUF371 domain-containing protein [Methanobacteriaceae archaeon]|jgi:hypothetical protein|nr:DUF371 domain-containing protein [Methanobacteriaceae archaeon]OPY21926.1 MAG: hypothetical protein A4E26_01475 [Methanobacterium sp. PtaU1.Bin097]